MTAARASSMPNEGLRRRLFEVSVANAAHGRCADPSDAAQLLEMAKYFDDAGAVIDEVELRADVDRLLKDKPYLGSPKPSKPQALPGPRAQPPIPPRGGREDDTNARMNRLIRGARYGYRPEDD